MEKRIVFKYHPNVYENGVIEHKEGICQCCGEKVNEYCNSMYCRDHVDCICLLCVANGRATEKFDGTFIQDAENVSEQSKKDELFNHTPGYVSWQGEYWLACCDDYCAFIGDVGTTELEDMGIADGVFAEYDARNEYEDIREYLVKAGNLAGYLFRCLHCGKYHLWVDAD